MSVSAKSFHNKEDVLWQFWYEKDVLSKNNHMKILKKVVTLRNNPVTHLDNFFDFLGMYPKFIYMLKAIYKPFEKIFL